MFNIYRKHVVFLVAFMAFSCSIFAQNDSTRRDTTRMNNDNSNNSGMMNNNAGMMNNSSAMMDSTMGMNSTKPFNGTKGFRKFSIGINGGVLIPSLLIGGTNNFSRSEAGLGYGAYVKYQFTHLFALQADVIRGTLKGHNRDVIFTGGPASQDPLKSFETEIKYAWSVNGLFTFGNINWLRPISKVIPYVSVGGGLMGYKPQIIKRSGGGGLVDYKSDGKSITEFYVPVTAGLKFNLSPLLNLDLGYRMNFVDGNNLMGNRRLDVGLHKDKFAYAFAGLEFSLGGKSKPQLMFDNPAYRSQAGLQYQLDSLKNSVKTVDSDGDGVIDQLDQCPNTPAGVAVNTHGCPLDTDGDGVPDYKDKELITPTYCQPVDADGVGKCPPPACCTDMVKKDEAAANVCNLGDLPSISFKGNMGALSKDAKAMLATVASKLKGSATCSITVTGYPSASKASQAVCNRRTNAVKTYLMEKEGISADRITVNCEVGGGDANTIDIKSASK